MKPDFFIVGAPKSGTTALSQYLSEHPQVFVSTPKEPHFFATDMLGIRFVDNEEAYRQLFAAAPLGSKIGEASVWYLYSTEAAERIHAFNPDARLLAMFRRPDEMVPSMHLQHYRSRDEAESSFAAAWQLEAERRAGRKKPDHCRVLKNLFYRDIANFGSQLENLLRVFPRDQVKVVFFEDFVSNPAAVYREVLAFLGLPDDHRSEFPIINAKDSIRNERLGTFLKRPPGALLRIGAFLRKHLGLRQLYVLGLLARLNRRPVDRIAVSDDLLAEIRDVYHAEIDKLAAITGRNLDSWHTPKASR